MKWVTRARPKTDRIACPWLVRRCIDPEASFVYVPVEQVFAVVKDQQHTPATQPLDDRLDIRHRW